jgi:hypothetical protein
MIPCKSSIRVEISCALQQRTPLVVPAELYGAPAVVLAARRAGIECRVAVWSAVLVVACIYTQLHLPAQAPVVLHSRGRKARMAWVTGGRHSQR